MSLDSIAMQKCIHICVAYTQYQSPQLLWVENQRIHGCVKICVSLIHHLLLTLTVIGGSQCQSQEELPCIHPTEPLDKYQ